MTTPTMIDAPALRALAPLMTAVEDQDAQARHARQRAAAQILADAHAAWATDLPPLAAGAAQAKDRWAVAQAEADRLRLERDEAQRRHDRRRGELSRTMDLQRAYLERDAAPVIDRAMRGISDALDRPPVAWYHSELTDQIRPETGKRVRKVVEDPTSEDIGAWMTALRAGRAQLAALKLECLSDAEAGERVAAILAGLPARPGEGGRVEVPDGPSLRERVAAVFGGIR